MRLNELIGVLRAMVRVPIVGKEKLDELEELLHKTLPTMVSAEGEVVLEYLHGSVVQMAPDWWPHAEKWTEASPAVVVFNALVAFMDSPVGHYHQIKVCRLFTDESVGLTTNLAMIVVEPVELVGNAG